MIEIERGKEKAKLWAQVKRPNAVSIGGKDDQISLNPSNHRPGQDSQEKLSRRNRRSCGFLSFACGYTSQGSQQRREAVGVGIDEQNQRVKDSRQCGRKRAGRRKKILKDQKEKEK